MTMTISHALRCEMGINCPDCLDETLGQLTFQVSDSSDARLRPKQPRKLRTGKPRFFFMPLRRAQVT